MNSTPSARQNRAQVEVSGPPRSAVPISTGLIGLIGLLAALIAMSGSDLSVMARPFIALVACALPMVLWEVFYRRVYRNPTTGLDLSSPRPLSRAWQTTFTKLVGLWSTWGIIVLGYWAARWFDTAKYDFALLVLGAALPALVLLSIPYVLFVDRHMRQPKDGLWHMGKWVTLNWGVVDKTLLADHARSWFIKGFFLVFMMAALPTTIGRITSRSPEAILHDIPSFVAFAIQGLFVMDLCFGTIGYIMTFRILDSHIRTANPHLSGWVAALICYPPFALMAGPLNYRENTQEWLVWFQGHDLILALWGAVLIGLVVMYAWSTVIFGIRFSNLTHRGIITTGPYRLFKHPAYLSKNIFWWMVYMPFLSTAGAEEAVRNCLLILSVNAIYFLRAKTEEKHLMSDIDYRDYSDWMAANGMIARLRRRIGVSKQRVGAGAAE